MPFKGMDTTSVYCIVTVVAALDGAYYCVYCMFTECVHCMLCITLLGCFTVSYHPTLLYATVLNQPPPSCVTVQHTSRLCAGLGLSDEDLSDSDD